ncbi:MAG: hypothetical protein ACYCZW_03730 [Minisyncoccota bacterium]
MHTYIGFFVACKLGAGYNKHMGTSPEDSKQELDKYLNGTSGSNGFDLPDPVKILGNPNDPAYLDAKNIARNFNFGAREKRPPGESHDTAQEPNFIESKKLTVGAGFTDVANHLTDNTKIPEGVLDVDSVIGVDPSLDPLGDLSLSSPSERFSEPEKKWEVNPKIVNFLVNIADKASDVVRKKLNAFMHFKVEHKSPEEILSNLGQLNGVISDGEYGQLVSMVEGEINDGSNYDNKSKIDNAFIMHPGFQEESPVVNEEEIISGELPYPDGFVPEPPPLKYPLQTPKAVPEPREIIPPKVNHTVITTEYLNRRAKEAGLEKLANEKTDEEKKRLISGATDFDELYEALRECKVIKDSRGNNLVAEELISEIKELITFGAEVPRILIPRITNSHGLRDKVSELFEASLVLDVSHNVVEASSAVETEPEPPPVIDAPEPPIENSLNEAVKEEQVKKTPIYGEVNFGSLEKKYSYTREILNEELDKAREEYAILEAEYKQEINKNKKAYRKILETLGVPEKQRPLPDQSQEYLEKKKAYLEAQWNCRNFIAGIDIKKTPFEYSNSLIGPEINNERITDVGVFKQREDETRIFINTVESMMPEKERSELRNRLDRGLKIWGGYSFKKRMLISTTVLLPISFITGTAGVAGVLAAAGWRVGRAGFGAGAATVTGKVFDGIRRKKIERDHDDRMDKYGDSDAGDREASERQLESIRTSVIKEEKEIKDSRIHKALVMAAVGGATTLGTGFVQNTVTDTFAHNTGVKIDDIKTAPKVEHVAETHVAPKVVDPNVPTTKPSFMDRFIKQTPDNATKPSAFTVPQSSGKVEVPFDFKISEPVAVELSEKGFIHTVADLQEKLQGKPMSPELTKLMSQSPEKIAMDLGLYKPGQVAESAFGLKGEQLTLDSNGDITLMHNDRSLNILFDGKDVHPYEGQMLDADKLSTSPVPDHVAPPKIVETVIPEKVPEVSPTTNQTELNIEAGSKEVMLGDTVVTTASVIESGNGKGAIVYRDVEIAQPSPDYTGPKDIILGKSPLKSEFQFSEDPQARLAYSKLFTKTIAEMDPEVRASMFDYHLPVQYKGGQINVFQKGEDVSILLNGEKIGSTKLIDGKFGFQFETDLKGGIFAGKSGYELAFEEAKKAIVKNIKSFKVTK